LASTSRFCPQARTLVEQEPELAERLELIETDGSLVELGDERFDVVLSKDSFEHYAEPESFVHTIARFLKPGGLLAVAFGPLWKSPYGGHTEFMTPVPWAHLLFPKSRPRRATPVSPRGGRALVRGGARRPQQDDARTVRGDHELNGLERLYVETNVSENPVVQAIHVVSKVAPLRELFTTNVYGVWRKSPAG
jgi:SAM-dependent methyltransferase